MPCLKKQADGALLLRVHVQPRAAKSAAAGLMGESLKIRLAAPPVDGKANQALVAFVADLCDLPKRAVSLKSGETSREKTLVLTGADEAALRRTLAPHLNPDKQ